MNEKLTIKKINGMPEGQVLEMRRKIAEMRGKIIENSINIENWVDSIILNYYIPNSIKQGKFLRDCLIDELFHFGLKIKIFEKIKFEKQPLKDFFDNLRKLASIRNIFAHASVSTNGTLVYNKQTQVKIKNPEELCSEFQVLHTKLVREITRLSDNLIKKDKK